MPEVNPVSVEEAIRQCAVRIGNGVTITANAYSAYLEADHVYDVAEAKAYLAAEGAAHERKHRATLEVQKERQARDVAEAAFKFADRQARALEAELRAYQSIGASLRQQYGVAGRGEQ